MTVLGYDSLKKVYPEVDESQRTPNGIDLRIGSLEKIVDDYEDVGVVLDEKFMATTEKVNWTTKTINGKYYDKLLVLEPNSIYRVNVLDNTHIPSDCIEAYALRSTFARNGIFMSCGRGDAGYIGSLQFLLENRLNKPFYTMKGTRFAQMIMLKLDKIPEQLYNGDYQGEFRRYE